MTALLALATPFVVSALTSLLKRVPVFANLSDEARTPAIRFLAAGVSLGWVLLTLWVSPTSLDSNALTAAIETAGLTFYAWISATGLFHGFKKA